MGQQQLLLITLGIILVGIAIFVAIDIFVTSAAQANRDYLTNKIYLFSDMAIAYYKKPVEQNGGGGSFIGWEPHSALYTSEDISSDEEKEDTTKSKGKGLEKSGGKAKGLLKKKNGDSEQSGIIISTQQGTFNFTMEPKRIIVAAQGIETGDDGKNFVRIRAEITEKNTIIEVIN
ncbi:MAG: hypothetical protein JW995_07645 [Melioribacteraceae bacterium]|nr:hypothetical protein [Melioribacteraceae bacterium]